MRACAPTFWLFGRCNCVNDPLGSILRDYQAAQGRYCCMKLNTRIIFRAVRQLHVTFVYFSYLSATFLGSVLRILQELDRVLNKPLCRMCHPGLLACASLPKPLSHAEVICHVVIPSYKDGGRKRSIRFILCLLGLTMLLAVPSV
jgi:hypothetical protein